MFEGQLFGHCFHVLWFNRAARGFVCCDLVNMLLCVCVCVCVQVFSVVVFGCITDQGWVDNTCIFNENGDACRFGNAIGIIAFLALMAFLVLDAVFDNISNVMHRKYIVMTDVVFSGV